MKTRILTTLTALGIAAAIGMPARAETTAATLAWEQPGYVMEVVHATAPAPRTLAEPRTSEDGVVLASEQPGYVMEVVYATASRSEAIENARAAARAAAIARLRFLSGAAARNTLGAPER